jgi:hypothetical protein
MYFQSWGGLPLWMVFCVKDRNEEETCDKDKNVKIERQIKREWMRETH